MELNKRNISWRKCGRWCWLATFLEDYIIMWKSLTLLHWLTSRTFFKTAESIFQQSPFCSECTVDAQQLVLWIYWSGFISRQQQQLTDLSVGEWHSDAVGSIFSTETSLFLYRSLQWHFKLWKPPVSFWKCINHATGSKPFTPEVAICLA